MPKLFLHNTIYAQRYNGEILVANVRSTNFKNMYLRMYIQALDDELVLDVGTKFLVFKEIK